MYVVDSEHKQNKVQLKQLRRERACYASNEILLQMQTAASIGMNNIRPLQQVSRIDYRTLTGPYTALIDTALEFYNSQAQNSLDTFCALIEEMGAIDVSPHNIVAKQQHMSLREEKQRLTKKIAHAYIEKEEQGFWS